LNRTLIIVVYFTTICSLSSQHINGLTAVATPDSFLMDPYPRLVQTEANWVCLVPYGFSRIGQSQLWYNVDRQWWGEKPIGVVHNIKLARKQNLQIMLKPQVYIPGGWPGDLDFDTTAEWEAWEEQYTEFINFYLDIAIEHEVEMFCMGTEFKISIQKRPEFWRSLIQDLRCRYVGQLTYSSNWDNYDRIPFWDLLDKIGVSCYMPLSEDSTPTGHTLDKAWKKKVSTLRSFSEKNGKQILFTEYGYLSVDGCAGKTWELEKKVNSLNINEQAQANAFNALYRNLWDEAFWAGGFIWKWFPNGNGHEGYMERDYTPQDKIAEAIITSWFSKDSKTAK